MREYKIGLGCFVGAIVFTGWIQAHAASQSYVQNNTEGYNNDSAVSADARYNAGVRLYRSGNYTSAAELFSRALATQNKSLEQQAAYNAGNSAYRIAQSLREVNPQEALTQYTRAREHYKRALTLDGADADAQFNYELAAHQVKVMKERVKKEPRQCPNPGNSTKQNQQENTRQEKEASASSAGQKQSTGTPQNQKSTEQDKKNAASQEQNAAAGEKSPAGSAQGNETAGDAADTQNQQGLSRKEALALLENMRDQEGYWGNATAHEGQSFEPQRDW